MATDHLVWHRYVHDTASSLGRMIGDNADADVAGASAASIPAILVRKQRRGIEPYCEDLGGIAAVVDG